MHVIIQETGNGKRNLWRKNISTVVFTLWEELTGKGHERGFWEDESVPYFVEKGVSHRVAFIKSH